MSQGRWRISVTAPDWGQDHLSLDAIVAYVDDELAEGPHLRATQHLAQCPECAAQVVAQGQARAALRTAECPSLPSSLLTSLRSIPQEADVPEPPAGLSVTADGQLVSVLRPEAPSANLGSASDLPSSATADHSRRGRRFGTGVAVSGLALGAIAFALPTAAGPPAPVPTAADSGARDAGGASAVLDAQLRLPAPAGEGSAQHPAAPAAGPTAEPALDQLDQIPGSFYGP